MKSGSFYRMTNSPGLMRLDGWSRGLLDAGISVLKLGKSQKLKQDNRIILLYTAVLGTPTSMSTNFVQNMYRKKCEKKHNR